MATRLFVGNLPENTQENDLRDAFSNFGEVVNLDLKSKSAVDSESKTFAFVSLSGSNFNIESCIKHFSSDDFNGKRLYVTRARESFLERLQRERAEEQQKSVQREEPQESVRNHPVIKLGDKLNPRKRKLYIEPVATQELKPVHEQVHKGFDAKNSHGIQNGDQKRQDSDKKRMEAMRKKRQEFKNKQMIVKTGLTSVDKVQNKRVKFSDNEDDTPINGHSYSKPKQANTLFDDDGGSDDDVNFEIKKQFEGKKGQKVLDLQSRYKSDKRFVLDERFIDDDHSEGERQNDDDDRIEVTDSNEKAKQLNILQDVLGVAIRTKVPDDNDRRHKQKIGMLRFDPTQPEHAKFLAPVEEVKPTKKSKKKKDQAPEKAEPEPKIEPPRPEVSKEQFYKVSDTLKEAIAQPQAFSLRSLFGNNEAVEEEKKTEDNIPLDTQKSQKKPKVKNPLDPGERNPFVYDSSDSESEETKDVAPAVEKPAENKAVWKENLFFGLADQRLKEGLEFFNKIDTEPHKERRELKSLMKKRIYNKDRKNQMFQKKIGGRKKTMKKSCRKKS